MDKESPPRFAAAERYTSAKRNFVAKSDRAWRENVLKHILYYYDFSLKFCWNYMGVFVHHNHSV